MAYKALHELALCHFSGLTSSHLSFYSLCVSHSDLLMPTWRHWRPSHFRSCALTIPTGQYSSPRIHLPFFLTSYSAVLCSLSPPESILLCIPTSKCAPPPMTLSMLFSLLVRTTHLLIYYLYTFFSISMKIPWRQESRDFALNLSLATVPGTLQVVG